MERKLTYEQSCTIVKKKFKACGNRSACKLIDSIQCAEKADEIYRRSLKESEIALTPEEALALKLQTRLSCQDYRILRQAALNKQNPFFPPLAKVRIYMKFTPLLKTNCCW